MRTTSFFALALLLSSYAGPVLAQPPKAQEKPLALYGTFRELMAEGKFEIASNFLQLFLESNPTETELLELEKKYGTTVFLALRNVARWSEDAATDKKARANVEELIKRSKAASEKLLYDPARVAKYIRNLGATYEERVYAELELKRTGDFAIPFMVDELRFTKDKLVYSGLIESIGILEGSTIAGWIASLDGFNADQQFSVVSAIVSRPDVLNLQTFAQSDLSPYLWRIVTGSTEKDPTLRLLALQLLARLNPGVKVDAKVPEAQLTALARSFYDHTARFTSTRDNGDGSARTVPLWIWDAASSKLVKTSEVPISKAEEYYGLRYSRWVLELKPAYEPAQGLLLSLAAEHAIERARFGNLARNEPAVYKLLSDAPSTVLNDLLSRGLNEKKTSLVLPMMQVLGDRADRDAATPPAGPGDRPSLFIKALSYPDPQVQFAAAVGLLRAPVPVPPAVKPLIVDILRRAAAADTADNAMGTALLADPNRARSDSIASILRGLGYQVEVMTTGRELLRRINRASDFDLIMIDHHTPNPELIDLIGQIQADTKAANRPTMVVASSDKPRLPTYDQLLVRFSALIASTENDQLEIPAAKPPRKPDEGFSVADITKELTENAKQRDQAYRRTVESRLARLNRIIDSTGVQLDENQRLLLNLRIELLALAILKIQMPYSLDSAPDTMARVAQLRRQLALQPQSSPYGMGVPTLDLIKMMERFEADLSRVPPRKLEFEKLYSLLDPSDFGLPVESFRDPAIELRLGRTLRNYPSVRVIAEPYGRTGMVSELKAAYQDPAQAPRDAAEKRVSQKTAVEWLRRMAIGDVPGYEIKSAETELCAALRNDDLADAAIEAVEHFRTSGAQEDLLVLVLNGMRPVHLRRKAADAVIRHIQTNESTIPKTLLPALVELSGKEPDLDLRGKLLTLKGMLAFSQTDFVDQLKGYNPPLFPPKVAPVKGDAPPPK